MNGKTVSWTKTNETFRRMVLHFGAFLEESNRLLVVAFDANYTQQHVHTAYPEIETG